MLVDKMIRAARLDNSLYEEVERDENATTEAMVVVILASLASGVGLALGLLFQGNPGQALASLAGGTVSALIGWIITAVLTYWVGTGLFGGTATLGEMLRTIGFARSPGVLLIFALIPICGVFVALGVAIWVLVATVIAIRQALDFDTGRAIATGVVAVIAGFIIQLIWVLFTGLLGSIF